MAYQATTVPARGQLALEAQAAILHHPPRRGIGRIVALMIRSNPTTSRA
jgi:hypothetical protein